MSEIEVDKETSINDCLEEIERIGYVLLYKKLLAYATNIIRKNPLDGKTPNDFASDTIIRLLNGERTWNKEKDFIPYCFDVVKSLVYNAVKKEKNNTKYIEAINHLEDFDQHEQFEDADQIKNYMSQLDSKGACKVEIDIFECWSVGITKKKEIIEYLEIDDNDYRNKRRSLLLKTPKLNLAA